MLNKFIYYVTHGLRCLKVYWFDKKFYDTNTNQYKKKLLSFYFFLFLSIILLLFYLINIFF